MLHTNYKTVISSQTLKKSQTPSSKQHFTVVKGLNREIIDGNQHYNVYFLNNPSQIYKEVWVMAVLATWGQRKHAHD